MALHNQTGQEGESLGIAYLLKNGYEILHRNWRFSYYEIDIIARKGKMVHIIEVKARNQSSFGYPEDSVGFKKFKRLQRAAHEFLQQNPSIQWVQYDILSVTLRPEGEPDFFLLEDVFM